MAQKSENKAVSSLSELNELFKHDESRKVIMGKLVMPRPGDGGKTLLILNSQGDDGTVGPVKVVKNSKFKDGNGIFMTVAEHKHLETSLQMGLGKSLFNAFDRMCNTEGFTLADLPGKIVQLTANYYTAPDAPKCSNCMGRGCNKCEGTGNSTVFSVQLRRDLMESPTKAAKGKIEDTF